MKYISPDFAGRCPQRLGWRQATRPLTSTHFAPEKFTLLGWNSWFPNWANKPKYSLYDILFRAQPEKWHTGSHSTSQGQKKSLSYDAGCEECCSRQKRVIRQNIPPSSGNPLVSWYFGFWKWAMVKVLRLDDSEWKDVPYYPYDLVHDDNRK